MDTPKEFVFEMEEIDFCPVCGSKEIEPVGVRHYPVKTGEKVDIPYSKCKSCTHIFMTPRPTQESYDKLYSTGAYRAMIDGPETGGPSLINYAEESIRGHNLMQEIVPQMEKSSIYVNSIVDVGGSTGMTLYMMRYGVTRLLNRNLEKLLNVEPDATFAMEGRRIGIADVRSIEQAMEFAPFDLVLCVHVLEHFNNPVDFLKKLQKLGTTGTSYFISVPHPDTENAAYSLFHPQAFTQDSLTLSLKQAGLERMFHKYNMVKGKILEHYILAKVA